MDNKLITLSHGSGGRMTQELIEDIFKKHFSNDSLNTLSDASIVSNPSNYPLAFTTDSFVVDPIFFPGGNIGKLAVCGTVNDLAVSGAVPLALSAGFILEEGLEIDLLEQIVISMQQEAAKAKVNIVTGDTKVVPKGKCDKIFINTSGIGYYLPPPNFSPTGKSVRAGDKIIISGTLGDHGMTIMKMREELQFQVDIQSDCACLNHMIRNLVDHDIDIKFMRDPTRGGLATTLCEMTSGQAFGSKLLEKTIPVTDVVQGICDLLGFDPLYVANEGKVLIIVSEKDANKVLQLLHQNELGLHAAVIGEIVNDHPGLVALETIIGGTRIIDMPAGDQLPRIC